MCRAVRYKRAGDGREGAAAAAEIAGGARVEVEVGWRWGGFRLFGTHVSRT